MLGFFVNDIALSPTGDVAMTANAGSGVGGFDILHPDGTWTNANAATYGLGIDWPYPADNTRSVGYRANGHLLFSPSNAGLHQFDGTGFTTLVSQVVSFEHISFTEDGRGWATAGRVAHREGDNGIWTRFLPGSGLPAGDIAGLVHDPIDPQAMWIGAQFGVGKTIDGVNWTIIPREAVGLTRNSTGYHITAFDVADDGTLWIGSGRGLFHYDPVTELYDTYDQTNSPFPTDNIVNIEIAPDGSVWVALYEFGSGGLGGIAQLKDGVWRLWRQQNTPLPHNQTEDLESRATSEGYEIWISSASQAIAVISVEGDNTCFADLNVDGNLDFFDISLFITLFSLSDPSTDLDQNGLFNFFDVSSFITLFGAGCP